MAIFYFNAQAISRSSGKNACRAAAYNARTEIVDLKAGKSYNYSDRTDLAHSLIMTPAIEDLTFKIDRSALWNLVEAGEKRPDAQLARSLVLALPTEIDHQAKWLLTQKFVRDNFTSQGMVADVNIHDIDSHNPHLHVLLTMRDINEITPSGEIVFGLKNRTWNDKKLLERQKESWANSVNQYLELAQVPERIDHRTPTDRVPQIHIGTTAWEMEQRGIQTERGDLHRKIAEINRNIELLRKAAADTQQSLEIELRLEVERRAAAQRKKEKYETLQKTLRPMMDDNPVNHLERLKTILVSNLAETTRKQAEQAKDQGQPSRDTIEPNEDLIDLLNPLDPSVGKDRPVLTKLSDDYKSDNATLSNADRQQFSDQKEQTPLGKFITSYKKVITDYETDGNSKAKPLFDIDQTIKLLEKIAEEDPINKDGIERLNKTLKSLALENLTKTGKLSKLISELEKVRACPEQCRDSLQDRLNQEVNPDYSPKNAQTGQKFRTKKSRDFEI